MKIGYGWDRHRLEMGRPLLLGGIHIPFKKGELGHSDGDVLLHAVIDALLGACALGDIGTHFPSEDPAWKDAESTELLISAYDMVRNQGCVLHNLDATIILEKPKLQSYIDAIRSSLAKILAVSIDAVSVKAKTAEGFPPVGTGEAVEASVVVLVENEFDNESMFL